MPDASLKQAGLAEFLLLALRLRRRYRVEGDSMRPLLVPDDQVLVRRVRAQMLHAGDVVAARHPHQTDVLLIKWIESVTEDGQFVLAGLNPESSTDSRQFGPVSPRDILGKAVARL